MAWFGQPSLAYAMCVPAALAGILLPYAFPLKPAHQPSLVHGMALAHAALAALMSLYGLKSAYAFALWAVAGILCLLCPKQVNVGPPLLCFVEM